MENEQKVQVLVEELNFSMGCSGGQLRNGKGNKNDEC